MTSERCALGLRVMAAGKDYFTDKAPLTTLEQLEEREYRAASSIPAASIRVKDRVAACNVKIWEMVIYLTEIQAVIKGIL